MLGKMFTLSTLVESMVGGRNLQTALVSWIEGAMAIWSKLKGSVGDTSRIVNAAFDKAVKKTNVALDSETAQRIKDSAVSAIGQAKKIASYVTDLNGDGRVDAEDLKLAAEKAGIAWNSIDPDLKKALVAGAAAGVGVNVIPIVGQAAAVPAFVGTTAYFYLVAKLAELKAPKHNNRDQDQIGALPRHQSDDGEPDTQRSPNSNS